MKTIAEYWKDKIEQNNGKFLSLSSCWDVYGTKKIGANKRSTVYKDVQNLLKKQGITKIWAKVGAHGRSQHSKTEVLLFDVSSMNEKDLENANIAYKGNYFD